MEVLLSPSYRTVYLFSIITKQITTNLMPFNTVCYYLTVSVGQKSWHGVAGLSAQGLTRLEERCQPDL
jgi:hypothetical protein